MNVGGHEIAEGVVHQPVLGQATQAIEAGTGDADVKMAAAILRAGMADVEMALVCNLQDLWFKRYGEPAADRGDPVAGTGWRHGMT